MTTLTKTTKSKNAELKTTRSLGFTHTFTVFPDDLNYVGSLFGGKILAEMDIAAANAARKLLARTDCEGAVTVSLDRVDFKKPARLADIIEMHASIIGLGKASIVIQVKVIREDLKGNMDMICEARFTFVSMKEGKPYPHGYILLAN